MEDTYGHCVLWSLKEIPLVISVLAECYVPYPHSPQSGSRIHLRVTFSSMDGMDAPLGWMGVEIELN